MTRLNDLASAHLVQELRDAYGDLAIALKYRALASNAACEIERLRSDLATASSETEAERSVRQRLSATLRDTFAAAALTGLLARDSPIPIARDAYDYADLMMKARSTEGA